MIKIILHIYDFFCSHKGLGLGLVLALTAALVWLISALGYREDISDFLPLDSRNQAAMGIYQQISGSDRVIVTFQYPDGQPGDPDMLLDAVDAFEEAFREYDTEGVVGSITSQADIEDISAMQEFVYSHIPYLLLEEDYSRIDSLLSLPGYMEEKLQEDRRTLMLPSAGMRSLGIKYDPLGLFSPAISELNPKGSSMRYELYDGYIFSPDMSRVIATAKSRFGNVETEHNKALAEVLERCAGAVQGEYPDVEVHLTGGPIIAVGNSRQIMKDSVLAVGLAVVLILALLFYAFRRAANLLLIALSIGWGWLFALAGLALCHDSVSLIVIGISSVILGIAVNYPLHYLAHLGHTSDKRKALKEIVMPLVVGNITTVGAFLTLVPLNSVALRDLGLFASFLLVGTILFSVLCLPHFARPSAEKKGSDLIDRLCGFSMEKKNGLVWTVLALTVILGLFSLRTEFDSNVSHINFMTREQREDMAYFSREMMGEGEGLTVYAVASGETLDAAFAANETMASRLGEMMSLGLIEDRSDCCRYFPSHAEQLRRLAMWAEFVSSHPSLAPQTVSAATKAGFSAGALAPFAGLLGKDYEPLDASAFEPLITAFSSSFCQVQGEIQVVSSINVPDREAAFAAEQWLAGKGEWAFDMESVNSAMAGSISDNFGYIGWACGFIVFFFLWISLGSIELALLSFVPMAVSWLWILGLMSLLGMQFNIVNIILATFIFGQGDDYTIFMTEGCCYEYAYRKRMLSSYKRSIIISALIMFIGIGTLIFAKHPALRSLAEVTIAGMFSVVLMAGLFPPLIFNFLVRRSDGSFRVRPLSFALLWEKICRREPSAHHLVLDRYRYKGAEVYSAVRKSLKGYSGGVLVESAYGEKALLYAFLHPEEQIQVQTGDEDVASLLRGATEGFVSNLKILEKP